MSNNQTEDQTSNPLLTNSHPLLRELFHYSRSVRVAKHQERYLTAFQFADAPNHFLTIPHESLLHNLNPSLSSLGNSSDAMAWSWVWPWDIAKFAVSAPGEFIREMGRFPHLAKGLIDTINTGDTNSENFNKVRGIANPDKMKEFFSRLGGHAEFKSHYPNAAKLCRVTGGEAAGGPLASPETIDPKDEKALKFVVEVLIAIGVVSGAIGSAAVAILGIVIGVTALVSAAAGATAIVVGLAATALILFAVGVIVIVLLGLAITVVAAIVALIIGGILIFQGGKSDNIDEYLTGELGLQLA